MKTDRDVQGACSAAHQIFGTKSTRQPRDRKSSCSCHILWRLCSWRTANTWSPRQKPRSRSSNRGHCGTRGCACQSGNSSTAGIYFPLLELQRIVGFQFLGPSPWTHTDVRGGLIRECSCSRCMRARRERSCTSRTAAVQPSPQHRRTPCTFSGLAPSREALRRRLYISRALTCEWPAPTPQPDPPPRRSLRVCTPSPARGAVAFRSLTTSRLDLRRHFVVECLLRGTET